MSRKYIKVEMPVEMIFSIFNTYAKIEKDVKLLGVIELFNIYNYSHKLKLEKALSNYAKGSKKIVTNKLKPLKLKVINIEIFSWKIVIYQENAQGVKLFSIVNENELPKYIFDTLKPISNDLKIIRKLKDIEYKIEKDVADSEKGIYFLKNKDVSILSKRKELTSLEENQILFTYRYYASIFDKNVSKIDDLEQQRTVLKLNEEVRPILDKLIDLMTLHGIKIEKGVWYDG